jgi:hypothetical protein
MDYQRMVGIAVSMVTASVCLLAGMSDAAEPETPLMGWASWNCFYHDISEAKIKAQADALVSTGLADAGYRYVNIDDGFWDNRNADGSLRINSTKFPKGFKELADYIHSKGLKAGFYSDAGDWTCGAVHGGETTGEGVGLYQHEQQDIDLAFQTWGFDYIKVDYCGAARHLHLDEETQYTKIREALDATGRDDIIYNVCRWQFPGAWVCSVGNSWRIADDISANWSSIIRILDLNTYLSGFSSRGHYNDMDMLEVGNGNLTADENKSHFALWCILSSPLVLGNDLTRMSNETLNLLKNTEAIAINQDTSGFQARLISDDGNGGQVWGRRLNNFTSSERAVVLFNRSSGNRTISVQWKDLDLTGAATVRDLLNKKDLGSFTTEFSSSVPSHGAVFVKMVGSESRLQEHFEAENSMMNNFNLTVNNQIVANQAKPVKDAVCSGGAKVGYLGNSEGNFLEFRRVWANAETEYQLSIHYLCGEDRSATLTVNEHDTVLTGLNSGGFSKVDSVVIPVKLTAGLNTIRFSNATGHLPDIDAIRLNVNDVVNTISSEEMESSRKRLVQVRVMDGFLEIYAGGVAINGYIYDVSGKVLQTVTRNHVSTRLLQPGAYILSVRTPQGRVLKPFVMR